MRLQAHRYVELESSPLHVTVPERIEAGSWEAVFRGDTRVAVDGAVGDDNPSERVPLSLEIGIGKDRHIIEQAAAHPDQRFIGLEYSRKKLDKVLSKALARGVDNLRLMRADAVRILEPLFEERSLDTAYIFFPDPWPKKRHRKKRIVQSEFIRLLSTRLTDEGRLELRTDDPDYIEQMVEVLEREPTLENEEGPGKILLDPRSPETHIPTLFESKFRVEGRQIHYLYYRKRS